MLVKNMSKGVVKIPYDQEERPTGKMHMDGRGQLRPVRALFEIVHILKPGEILDMPAAYVLPRKGVGGALPSLLEELGLADKVKVVEEATV